MMMDLGCKVMDVGCGMIGVFCAFFESMEVGSSKWEDG